MFDWEEVSSWVRDEINEAKAYLLTSMRVFALVNPF